MLCKSFNIVLFLYIAARKSATGQMCPIAESLPHVASHPTSFPTFSLNVLLHLYEEI